ncbi:MAG: RagB/SusD family nutrient uptake outer membrane protein [Muribaculaceae bacterium]|nr:RagB/SusD family nutrient uptake outer membrane protein [Muribaculaceae bacterium]
MKKILYSILLLGATLSLTGCKDFLDPRNLSNPQDAESYFSGNPEDLRPVAYDAIRYVATQVDLLDQAADLFINPRAADDGTFSMFQTTPDNGTVADYYKNVDGGINKANAMIYYGGMQDDQDLIAEGRFLRVFGYYYMTQQFGAVPYVDYYIQDANRDYPRMPLEELYPILLEECTDLYNNSSLPAQNHEGSASKQAVAAIAAKIALAAAWDLDTELIDAAKGTYSVKSTDRFRQAAQWAEKAINGIQLTMSFADKWAWWNEGNEEEIFSAQYDRNGYPGDKSTGGHSLMNNYIAYFGNCVQSGLKGTGSGGTNVASAKSASLFEKGDTRFEGTFMTTMYNAPKDDGGNANWELGYMAWYNQPEDVQKTLPVALRFYAPETTKEEAEADIRQLVANGQAKSFATNTYGVNLPFAAIITGTEVTQWFFKADGSMPTATTVPYTDFIVEAANNGTTVTKYDDPTCGAVTGSQDYRDIPLLHVSEMYLVAAEAYLLAGDEASSLKYINDVRKRAGAPQLSSFGAYEAPYTTSLNFTFVPLDLVLDERARECYAERTRYFDLRRTKQLVRYNLEFSRFMNEVSKMANAQGEIKWYRPIPQAEIDNNTAISSADQNPGY